MITFAGNNVIAMGKKFVLAIDSFKGCMTSVEAERAVERALRSRVGDVEIVSLPMADGGEGMLGAFTAALGGRIERAWVHNQMMRRVEAKYGVAPGGTAIVEVAEACGLTLVAEDERNPMRATTYGVGELVADVVGKGYRRFIVGLGGSGTSDAGIGMLRALTDRLAPRGGTIDDALAGALGECSFTLASDVDNPLCGPRGAAMVFARQKGATADMIPRLEERARRFARMSALHFGYDRSGSPGAGAAGGLGYAFMQYLGGETRSGADLLLDISGFDDALDGASCVITGEGHADGQTLMGKLPLRVMRRAGRKGVPTWLLAGRVSGADRLLSAGFAKVICVTPDGMDTAEAVKKEVAVGNIECSVVKVVIGS